MIHIKPVLLLARGIARAPWLMAVDLSLTEGSLVAILARPGAGAERLLRILALLEEPDSGELYLEGRLMTGLPAPEREEARRHLIGFDPTRAPRILLFSDPIDLSDLLRRIAGGQTILYATSDPLTAAAAHQIYRLGGGSLYRLQEN